MNNSVGLAVSYGLRAAGRRRRALVLPGITVATGAFLLVLVAALMPAVRRQGAVFGDGAAIGRATVVISVIVSLLGALQVAITATRSIAQRVREIGVLCSFGVPPRSVLLALLVEPVLTGTLGGFAGAVLGAAVAIVGSASGAIDAPVAAATVAMAAGAAVLLSLVAAALTSAAPTWRAVHRPPLSSLTA
jgi:ABC-type lipoprotein release transport system permease subunit